MSEKRPWYDRVLITCAFFSALNAGAALALGMWFFVAFGIALAVIAWMAAQ